jgi:uridine kinase
MISTSRLLALPLDRKGGGVTDMQTVDTGMSSGRTAFVISVSGTSGSGKSTLVRGLARDLEATSGLRVGTLFFDDYASVSQLPEKDLPGWLDRGADPGEWRTDQLVADLTSLVAGNTVTPPVGELVGPLDIVVLEEPFGRARPAMRPLIGLALHIALPLHIALARRLLRDFVPEAGGIDPDGTGALRGYVEMYRTVGGTIYELIDGLASTTSDVSLDGLLDSQNLLELALSEVARRAPAGIGSPVKPAD